MSEVFVAVIVGAGQAGQHAAAAIPAESVSRSLPLGPSPLRPGEVFATVPT